MFSEVSKLLQDFLQGKDGNAVKLARATQDKFELLFGSEGSSKLSESIDVANNVGINRIHIFHGGYRCWRRVTVEVNVWGGGRITWVLIITLPM